MAQTLKKIFTAGIDEVVQDYTIESWHVSQSVDAFTGTQAYDITLSGSLVVTGSVAINGLSNVFQNDILTYNSNTGLISYTASSAFNVNNFYTSSVTQSITSSVVNNNINSSTINQTIISSSVNTPAPSDKYVQYNSGSTFGASIGFQYDYTIGSLSQGDNCLLGPSATYAHVEGVNTVALQSGAHAEGGSTLAFGIASHAEGGATLAFGIASHAEGYLTTSSGAYSHAEGNGTISSGSYSHAEGNSTKAIGNYSHAEGYQTSASGHFSHAEGGLARATGVYSHAEGQSTFATATGSHAEGQNTQATGVYSHAEGAGTLAQAGYSHTEGFGTTVSSSAVGGHAEGSSTTVRGQYAHSEGASTLAIGAYSHVEGYLTTSSINANYAHAEGIGTIADGNYQHVMGAYNSSNTSPSSFIIGNGTDTSTRKNLIFASGSSFQVSGSLNVSGSFSAQYRDIGVVEVANISSGILLSKSDYNVVFTATNTLVGFKNAIQLPSGMDVGSIIYLQRVSGNIACTISGSSGHTINGAAGFSFPTTVYTRRMFVFNGSGWYVEV